MLQCAWEGRAPAWVCEMQARAGRAAWAREMWVQRGCPSQHLDASTADKAETAPYSLPKRLWTDDYFEMWSLALFRIFAMKCIHQLLSTLRQLINSQYWTPTPNDLPCSMMISLPSSSIFFIKCCHCQHLFCLWYVSLHCLTWCDRLTSNFWCHHITSSHN
jgi:hypothetical protein